LPPRCGCKLSDDEIMRSATKDVEPHRDATASSAQMAALSLSLSLSLYVCMYVCMYIFFFSRSRTGARQRFTTSSLRTCTSFPDMIRTLLAGGGLKDRGNQGIPQPHCIGLGTTPLMYQPSTVHSRPPPLPHPRAILVWLSSWDCSSVCPNLWCPPPRY
jgi:hypothetical protein